MLVASGLARSDGTMIYGKVISSRPLRIGFGGESSPALISYTMVSSGILRPDPMAPDIRSCFNGFDAELNLSFSDEAPIE